MGREKRKARPPAGASGSKERRRRTQRVMFDPLAPVPEGLVAKPAIPKSRHHTYFEFVENTDKKEKILEVQETENKSPPPGFEFVPIGNPWLTKACKDLSREKGAMIFVVSPVTTNSLSQQVNRLGHHIRQTIVEEAKTTIADLPHSGAATPDGKPEPIPETQAEYHAQADAAIRDLFPRIPNTDRQIIIEHAFTRRANTKGELPVGFSDDIPLARRVQLAVLAHIRHSHTRYDDLLREAGWQAARKAVETLCLDILVKWRGDEETGRDQLDEILREVVVISDSEGESSDDEEMSDDSSTCDSESSNSILVSAHPITVSSQSAAVENHHQPPGTTSGPRRHLAPAQGTAGGQPADPIRKSDRKDQRGFKRYRAWQDAILRNRETDEHRSGYLSDDTSEYNPRHPQIPTRQLDARQPTSYTSGQFEPPAQPIGFMVSSGLVPRDSPSYSRPVGTPPRYVHHVTDAQASREELNAPLYDRHANSSSSLRVMSPITNRLRDLLVPSIEPTSPETMKPAFVRAVPPRQQDHLDSAPSRTQELFYKIRSQSPVANQARDSPDRGGRRVISDHAPERRLQPSNFAPDAPSYIFQERIGNAFTYASSSRGGPPPPDWTRSYDQPLMRTDLPRADRIIVNASRPGTRANPILMEDRGGFFERVVLPPESREAVHQNEAAIALHSEPYRATESYRVVSSDEGARILRDGRGNADIEVVPISRSGPVQHSQRFYGHQQRPHQPYVPGQPETYQSQPAFLDAQAGEGPSHHLVARPWPTQETRRYPQTDANSGNTQPSYRGHHGKRPAVDDHYQNTPRGRRPRARQPDDVIVLE